MQRTVDKILRTSDTLRRLVDAGEVGVVGAVYDVTTGDLKFVTPSDNPRAGVRSGILGTNGLADAKRGDSPDELPLQEPA